MPDRHLLHATPGQAPTHQDVQQLIEAERGQGAQGIVRTWQASDSNKVVLTSDSGGVKISRDNGTTAPRQVVVDGTTAGGALTGTYPNPTLDPATMNALIPPGTIWAYGGGVIPAGWLLCDGASYLRATYPTLFAALGGALSPWGLPDGTHFNVPDYRGRVILGVGPGHALGQTGGSETAPTPTLAHTHPGSHHHGLNGHFHGLNGHTHPSGGSHNHGLNGHTHPVDINHGHTGGAGGGTGPVTSVNGGGAVPMVRDVHDHVITVNGTGTLLTTASAPTPTTLTTNVGTPDVAASTTLNTQPPTAPTTDTADDSSAPAASYGTAGTIPTMMPFGTANAMIRIGV